MDATGARRERDSEIEQLRLACAKESVAAEKMEISSVSGGDV